MPEYYTDLLKTDKCPEASYSQGKKIADAINNWTKNRTGPIGVIPWGARLPAPSMNRWIISLLDQDLASVVIQCKNATGTWIGKRQIIATLPHKNPDGEIVIYEPWGSPNINGIRDPLKPGPGRRSHPKLP